MKQSQILILESNAAFAEELREHLSSYENYSICGLADDGEEGLELIEKLKPNVVLMSLLLKNADGFTVLERAKKNGLKPNFVVLGNFFGR